MITIYALITKEKRFQIVFYRKTVEKLDEKINQFYYDKRAMKPKGNDFKKEDLLKNYLKAEMDKLIEDFKESLQEDDV